ncbi:MAG: hypothetical protein JWN00_4192 [Actinomycetia bacterium]|nr:hypothetical protein [Actinomycetes bacterium]
MDDLRAVMAELDAATERMLATVAKLTDEDLRQPSALPGWTRGHVVAHIARNADSCWNLLEWARTGVEVPQYPNDEVREAGVEASAGRPAAELLAENEIAAARFAAQMHTMPEAAWQATVRARAGWAHPASYTIPRRWREVEVHHADLAAGFSDKDWSEAYIRWELTDTLAALRSHGGLTVTRVRAIDADIDVRLDGPGPEARGSARELLSWLTGRTEAPSWPAPPRWPLPAPLGGSS